MEKEPGLLAQALLLIGALAGLYGVTVLVFSLDKPRAPQASVGSPSPSQPAALFSFPLDYSASVTQSGNGIAEPRTRFYVAKSVREAQ